MDYIFAASIVVGIVLVGGALLVKRSKYGSWAGAALEGSIEQIYGEIELARRRGKTEMVKVMEMRDSEGEGFVGLVITEKAPMAVSMTVFRLSKTEAKELAGLFAAASK